MEINYKITTDKTDWSEVSELFRLVGWGERTAEELKCAFTKSSYVQFAYEIMKNL